jgi:TPR repeat protein
MANKTIKSRRRLAGSFAIAFAFAQGTVASAATLADGRAAWNSGDFATAMQVLRPLADAGDPTAEYFVGLMYFNGQGVPEDDAEASRWFEAAAKKGSADALYSLCQGRAVGGVNVQRDSVAAYVWCDLAVAAYKTSGRPEAAGNAAAMRDLMVGKLTADQATEAKAQVERWTSAH